MTRSAFACAHPRSDVSEGPWSAEIQPDLHVMLFTDSHVDMPNTTSVNEGKVVMSSVVCLPGTAP